MKLFKIVKINLQGKVKDWFKKLQPTFANWNEMKTSMQQKKNVVDLDELKVKIDFG
jgi:Ni,Fe-hydrogenase III large subunit